MKRFSTKNAYNQRITRVLSHIYDNLDSELSLLCIAEIACVSPYHFHRLYHAVTGETLNGTLSRLRLHRAAVALDKTDQAVSMIARKAGYGSTAAFSRAFTAVYGHPPSRYRISARQRVGSDMIDISIQDRADLALFVTEHNGLPHRIGQAFDRLIAWAGPRDLLSEQRIGVAIYLTGMEIPANEQRSLAGFSLPLGVRCDDPNITTYTLPGGRHAVALHKGPYARIGDTRRALYSWIAQADEQPADLPAFEVSLNNPRSTSPKHLLTEVCVPLVDKFPRNDTLLVQ